MFFDKNRLLGTHIFIIENVQKPFFGALNLLGTKLFLDHKFSWDKKQEWNYICCEVTKKLILRKCGGIVEEVSRNCQKMLWMCQGSVKEVLRNITKVSRRNCYESVVQKVSRMFQGIGEKMSRICQWSMEEFSRKCWELGVLTKSNLLLCVSFLWSWGFVSCFDLWTSLGLSLLEFCMEVWV